MSFKCEYIGNTGGKKPLIRLLPFVAGATTTVEPGDVLALAAGTFAPLAADQAMAATIAIAQKRITTAHLAGYYPALIPQPGDIFKMSLAAAANPSRGASVYVTSAAQTLATAGANVFGNVLDHAGYPLQQGDADTGDVIDRGTTIGNVSKVLLTIKAAVSYFAALQL